MSGAVTSNLHRETTRERCLIHGLEFGQERLRNPETREWGPWLPPLAAGCSECAKELSAQLERERSEQQWAEEIYPRMKADIFAESNARADAEEGWAERIAALADSRMPRVFEEWWAANRPGFIACADNEERMRIDDEIISERRARFFEEQKAVAGKASAELQAKLEAEREQRIKESLGSWAMLG
jgi:hypothetical protein